MIMRFVFTIIVLLVSSGMSLSFTYSVNNANIIDQMISDIINKDTSYDYKDIVDCDKSEWSPYLIKYINVGYYYVKSFILSILRHEKSITSLLVLTALVDDERQQNREDAIKIIFINYDNITIRTYGGLQLRDALIRYIKDISQPLSQSIILLGYFTNDREVIDFIHQHKWETDHINDDFTNYGIDIKLCINITLALLGENQALTQVIEVMDRKDVDELVFILYMMKYPPDNDISLRMIELLKDKRKAISMDSYGTRWCRVCDVALTCFLVNNNSIVTDIKPGKITSFYLKIYSDEELSEAYRLFTEYVKIDIKP